MRSRCSGSPKRAAIQPSNRATASDRAAKARQPPHRPRPTGSTSAVLSAQKDSFRMMLRCEPFEQARVVKRLDDRPVPDVRKFTIIYIGIARGLERRRQFSRLVGGNGRVLVAG